MLFEQISQMPVLPTLPTRLPTEMKNELMLELTNGKYDWEGLVNDPSEPSFEETMLIMNAGEEGRDILLCYKRMICKRIAEAAFRPTVHNFANALVKNNIEDLRMNQILTEEEYIKATDLLQKRTPEEEPFWETYATKKLEEKADELDLIVKQIGEMELENGSPFSQEEIDECYKNIVGKRKTK